MWMFHDAKYDLPSFKSPTSVQELPSESSACAVIEGVEPPAYIEFVLVPAMFHKPLLYLNR